MLEAALPDPRAWPPIVCRGSGVTHDRVSGDVDRALGGRGFDSNRRDAATGATGGTSDGPPSVTLMGGTGGVATRRRAMSDALPYQTTDREGGSLGGVLCILNCDRVYTTAIASESTTQPLARSSSLIDAADQAKTPRGGPCPALAMFV